MPRLKMPRLVTGMRIAVASELRNNSNLNCYHDMQIFVILSFELLIVRFIYIYTETDKICIIKMHLLICLSVSCLYETFL